MILVVVRDKVNQDGSALEYIEVVTRVVDESRNTSIRVDLMRAHKSASFAVTQELSRTHLDKPGLFLYILTKVNLFVRIIEPSVRGLEFFQQDGGL